MLLKLFKQWARSTNESTGPEIVYEEKSTLDIDGRDGCDIQRLALFSDNVSWKYGQDAGGTVLGRRDAIP